jgi:hypothetical protein
MSGPAGQATVEYAGLLGFAAVVGGALALIAGPPLADLARNALAGAISGESRNSSTVVIAAADIADVQSALDPSGQALTPDAALLALGQRHRPAESRAIAGELLLAAAHRAAPWIARRTTYRAWTSASADPYLPTEASGGSDRDVESATGAAVVMWVTVGRQRRAIEAALARHTDPGAVVPASPALARSSKLH